MPPGRGWTNGYGCEKNWFESVKEGYNTYYYLPGYYDYGTIDVYDFLNKVAASSTFNSDKVADVKAAFNNLVVYNKIGGEAGETYGLSMIFEPINSDQYWNIYRQAASRFPTWYDLAISLA